MMRFVHTYMLASIYNRIKLINAYLAYILHAYIHTCMHIYVYSFTPTLYRAYNKLFKGKPRWKFLSWYFDIISIVELISRY